MEKYKPNSKHSLISVADPPQVPHTSLTFASQSQAPSAIPSPSQTPHSSTIASPPITPVQSVPNNGAHSPAVAERSLPNAPDSAIFSKHKSLASPAVNSITVNNCIPDGSVTA